MPDLLTHAAIGALVRSEAPRQGLLWFVVGSMLPDVASRLPALGLVTACGWFDFSVPLPLLEGLSVCHTPLPYLVLCWLLALCLPRAVRAVAWINLSLAGVLHLALDATQRHLGDGYRLLFPLVNTKWELGWIDAEASLRYLPLTGAVVLLALGIRWWRRRRRGGLA